MRLIWIGREGCVEVRREDGRGAVDVERDMKDAHEGRGSEREKGGVRATWSGC